MSLLNKFFKQRYSQREDKYVVTITNELIRVDHPQWPMGTVKWKDIHTILLINTDKGPWLPDVWLTLISEQGKCMIPQGASGFEEIYNVVSKYNGFNFGNANKSMSCTDNAEFVLWVKSSGE